ncbi:hypothetical protein QFZ62_001915 [Clavibacter sp. B3I6]|uniref:hypothetical protein n=1 Tax=Clavibacter sp. B3I6 TaxID=3042268 RepID=UPI002781921C|nr:hypothetical protein [Clavibacter sp. B3I6]MDQ0744607.1 hypothetical protein [Clavibacter sp. B3I6]
MRGEVRTTSAAGDYAITTDTVMGAVSNGIGSDTSSPRSSVLATTMGDITVDAR